MRRLHMLQNSSKLVVDILLTAIILLMYNFIWI